MSIVNRFSGGGGGEGLGHLTVNELRELLLATQTRKIENLKTEMSS